ncbi:MAG: P44/Msp2 family outer membrane protein, partial [Azospirillaceae bacterium]
MRLAFSLCRGTALIALCLGSHGLAHAQGMDFDGNWYIQGGGGLNFADDIQLTPPQDPGEFIDFGYDLGFLAGGAVGYRWDNGFRTELEGVYRHNEFDVLCGPLDGPAAVCIDADNPALGQSGITNEVSSIGIMFNILYDIDTGTAITPYLGGGVGAGYVDWEYALGGMNVSIDGWGVALQGIAGVSYALSDSFELFTDYRYYTVLGGHDATFGAPISATLEIDEYAAHSVFFGARYHFLPPPPPPPAPAPVAEEPPPPAPAQDRFIVFFDWDRS